MGNWLKRLLFDWVFVLLYRLFQSLLNLVDFIESFFDIFAGTAKVFYQGNSDFLINIFFGHDAVTNAFWAMALIAIVLAFGFCIFQMARKAADVAGSVRQSVGQIMSNFFRCLLIILLINAITVAAINITNVLLDRINYALENAAVLDQEEQDKTFTDQEYATMAKILATVANYSVNPSADSRYNVNSCFNAIRPDLLSLHTSGFFEYDYPLDENGTPINYKYVLHNQRATGYWRAGRAWGASGEYCMAGTVAVRANEIPYGTKMYIRTPDGNFIYGYAVANDTGTGLMQGIIDVDLFYETYEESCLNSVRWVDIYILE